MKQAKHSRQLRAVQIALALLVALAASTAARQASAQAGQSQPQAGQYRPAEAQRAPSPASPSYGPVLQPQPITSEPGAQPEQTPQAQEEKAGANPAGRQLEVDPSARPAPQPKDPARADKRKEQKKGANRAARHSAPQHVDIVAAPAPAAPRLAPALPTAIVPGPAQINSCLGGVCTDTGGTTYHTGVGNAAVNSGGRLCTRSGNTMQCF